MFDIGFSEIVVCAIVALVVIGPERMPEAVRTVGLWIGRLKRSLRETRSEIERQIGVDDIRRQLHNEDIMRSLQDARRDMDNVIADTQRSINSENITLIQEYRSEPDLPYHAHMEENSLTKKSLELSNQDLPEQDVSKQDSANTNIKTENSNVSADVKILADKEILADIKTPSDKASL